MHPAKQMILDLRQKHVTVLEALREGLFHPRSGPSVASRTTEQSIAQYEQWIFELDGLLARQARRSAAFR